MSLNLQQFGIDRLDPGERLELIGLIWDSIGEGDASGQMPDWHRTELEKRIASADANPESLVPWETVKARLSKQ